MNKRQAKKNWKKYIYETGRYGCDICFGHVSRMFNTNDGWLNVSLGYDKKKLYLRQKHEKIGWTYAKYCWNCGRKFK